MPRKHYDNPSSNLVFWLTWLGIAITFFGLYFLFVAVETPGKLVGIGLIIFGGFWLIACLILDYDARSQIQLQHILDELEFSNEESSKRPPD